MPLSSEKVANELSRENSHPKFYHRKTYSRRTKPSVFWRNEDCERYRRTWKRRKWSISRGEQDMTWIWASSTRIEIGVRCLGLTWASMIVRVIRHSSRGVVARCRMRQISATKISARCSSAWLWSEMPTISKTSAIRWLRMRISAQSQTITCSRPRSVIWQALVDWITWRTSIRLIRIKLKGQNRLNQSSTIYNLVTKEATKQTLHILRGT